MLPFDDMLLQSPPKLRRSLRLLQARRESLRMERALATSKIFEYHVELQILKRKVQDLNHSLASANRDVVDTQTYMHGNGIAVADLVEEILDEDIALST
jgi:hypothetical protein